MRYIIPFLIFFAVSCGNSDSDLQKQSIEDLERAVSAIEDRQQAEFKIIEEQERIIEVLTGNLKKANSEGMREKIRNDINEKRVIIRDAEINLENQKKILGELYTKRDSLQKE